jgi:ferredoxin
MSERDPDRAVSQTVRARLALRDQILSGCLRSGERISEFQSVFKRSRYRFASRKRDKRSSEPPPHEICAEMDAMHSSRDPRSHARDARRRRRQADRPGPDFRSSVAGCAGDHLRPMRLLEAARHGWASAGRVPTDLRYETFGSSGLLPTAAFRVRIDHSGREIVVGENKLMLDALNEAGFEVMSDCQRGECGVCAIDVVAVDGQIDHRDVFFSDHQKSANGKICPCVSRAVGAITVNTLYRSDAR